MQYVIDGSTYSLNYQQLREDFYFYRNLSDIEFKKKHNVIKALHFACIVLYLKEAGCEMTVGDKGIIHQLVHLLHIPDEPLVDLKEVRSLFNQVLYLA